MLLLLSLGDTTVVLELTTVVLGVTSAFGSNIVLLYDDGDRGVLLLAELRDQDVKEGVLEETTPPGDSASLSRLLLAMADS